MNRIFKILILLLFLSCGTPSNEIIDYTKKKYGNNFKEGVIDLSAVFKFKWQTLYFFPPLTYPEDVTKETGIKYTGEIVPDGNWLVLFVNDGKIIKDYKYSNLKFGFSDNNNSGMYKIKYQAAKYKVKSIGTDSYWLYKMD